MKAPPATPSLSWVSANVSPLVRATHPDYPWATFSRLQSECSQAQIWWEKTAHSPCLTAWHDLAPTFPLPSLSSNQALAPPQTPCPPDPQPTSLPLPLRPQSGVPASGKVLLTVWSDTLLQTHLMPHTSQRRGWHFSGWLFSECLSPTFSRCRTVSVLFIILFLAPSILPDTWWMLNTKFWK